MLVNSEDIKKLNVEEALKRLAELEEKSKSELIEYPDGRIYRNDKLIAEEPDYFQTEWYNLRLKRPFPKVHENKIGDFKNWK